MSYRPAPLKHFHQLRSSTSELLISVSVGIIVLSALAITILRRRYGLDLADESFYLAIPLQYVLGAFPFRDELSLAQGSALLVAPLFYAFHSVTDDFQGLVLFTRYAYLVFQCFVAMAVVLLTRVKVGTPTAMCLGLILIAFAPYNIWNFSYNNTASYLFVLTLVFQWHLLSQPSRFLSVAVGLCAGLIAVCYPTLGVVCILAIVGINLRPGGRGSLYLIVIGCLLAILPVGMLALSAGLDALGDCLAYAMSGLPRTWGIARLAGLATSVFKAPRFISVGALAAVVAALCFLCLYIAMHRRFPKTPWGIPAYSVALVSIIAPLAAFFIVGMGSQLDRWPRASLIFIALYASTGPLWWLMERRAAPTSTTFLVIWIPSALGGLATAYTSTNGLINAGIGMLPALIATVILASYVISSTVTRPNLAGLACIPGVAVGLILLFYQLNDAVYNDDPLAYLQVTVRSGAFSGIVTSDRKLQLASAMATDIQAVGAMATVSGVSFHPLLSGGYLIHPARSRLRTTYSLATASEAGQNVRIDYHNKTVRPGDVAMLMKEAIDRYDDELNPIEVEDRVMQMLRSQYTCVIERLAYDVCIYPAAARAADEWFLNRGTRPAGR